MATETISFIERRERCEQQIDLSVCSGCTECYLRCAHDVPASRDEWNALQSYIADADADAQADLARVLSQDKTEDLGDGVTVQMCRYFDMETRHCAVYPVRPLVCRLLGHVEWLPCPINKVTQVLPTPDALALMRGYAETERRTFAEWEEYSLYADETDEAD